MASCYPPPRCTLKEAQLQQIGLIDIHNGIGLLRRVRDYAQVMAEGVITEKVALEALSRLEVDHLGLDELDHKVLLAIIKKFDGGPVGLDTIAASISEEADTIMDVYEPYLLQLGFLERTPRGRVATRHAYEHLKLPYKQSPQLGLFSP